MRKKTIQWLWAIFVILTLAVVGLFFMIHKGWIGYMPPIDELQSPISKYASQIITADGKVLGTWSKNANRVHVDYDSIARPVFKALIATEDERFYEHSGIDARAVGRAIVKRGLLRQTNAGGGSTITQQLAKQLYSTQATNKLERLFQKPIEWVIAIELEKHYTKAEILTLYLNYFDFLHNAVGIKTAAEVYFSKHPKDLKIEEAAMLVGMCKNPSYYNPVGHPERALQRRNVVLGQMLKVGSLTQVDYDSLSTLPLKLQFKPMDHKRGDAPYLREYLRRIMMAKKPNREHYLDWQKQQYYDDSLAWETDPLYGWCNKNTKRDGQNYDIYVDGLKVYTTLDSRMQEYAEQSVRHHLQKVLQPAFDKQRKTAKNFPYSNNLTAQDIKKILNRSIKQTERYRVLKESGASEEEIKRSFRTPTEMTVFGYDGDIDTIMTPLDSIRYYKSLLRSSLVSIDPTTGAVKAYVGGVDYRYFQYDMGMMGRRQVGSTIKPLVYAMAMEDGYTPQSTINNYQRTYMVAGRPWRPRNGSKARYGTDVSLLWGLSQSNNWITAELMHQVDPRGERFLTYLESFGITQQDIYPSIVQCLGPSDIKAVEMASAYTAFVNKGIRCAPLLVTRIEDNEGNIIAEFTPRTNEVISEQSATYMLEMLRAVVDQGTGGRLRHRYDFKYPAAGKTGTTNNNSDGWFVGIVPRLVTACWVGGDDRDIRLHATSVGQGASSALPIWAMYMKKVYKNAALGYLSNKDFQTPFIGRKAENETEEIVENQSSGEKLASPKESGAIDNLFN